MNEQKLSIYFFLLSFLIYFKYYAITFFPIFPPLSLLCPAPQTLQHSPTYFTPMGCTYKFFQFSVSYTIFDLSLSILCLPILLLLSCTFSPLFLPSPSPLKTLHVMSISLILFLFQLFTQFLFSLFFRFLNFIC